MDVTVTHAGVRITVMSGPYVGGGSPTPDAVSYYTRLIASLDSIREFAATTLLNLYNGAWQCDEIGVLDRAGFVARLGSPAVTLFDEIGTATVYFEDGEMFGGHYIEVDLKNGTPTSADIVG